MTQCKISDSGRAPSSTSTSTRTEEGGSPRYINTPPLRTPEVQRGGRYNVYTTNIPDTRPPFGSLPVSQHAGLISLSRQHVTKVFLNLSNYAAGDSWASFLWSRKLTGSGCTVSGYRGVGGVGVGGYGENADLWLKQRVRLINSGQKLRTTTKIIHEQKTKTKNRQSEGGKNEHNQQKKDLRGSLKTTRWNQNTKFVGFFNPFSLFIFFSKNNKRNEINHSNKHTAFVCPVLICWAYDYDEWITFCLNQINPTEKYIRTKI